MPARRRAAWMAVALLLSLLFALPAAAAGGHGAPAAVAGVLDLRGWDFGRDGIAALDGQWRFTPGRFDDPRAPAPAGALVAVPGDWGAVAGADAPYGFGSYHLRVECIEPPPLALNLPVQHSAVHWFVNGLPVARQGTPAALPETARPVQQLQVALLGDARCPLDIVAHVSNFDARHGGLVRAVELGDAQAVLERDDLARMRDLLVMGALVVLGSLPLLFYLGHRRDANPLYFGLMCVAFAFAIGLTGTRVLQPLLAGLSWDGYLRVVFVDWYAVTVLYALYLRAWYRNVVGLRAVRLVLAWGGVSTLAVLFTPSAIFTWLLPSMAAGAALVGAYLGWRLVVAWGYGRSTAKWMLGALAVYVLGVAHDAWQFAHLARSSLLPYAVLVFVAAPATLMARRLGRALLLEERMAIEQRERADLLVRSTQAGLLDWDAVAGRVQVSERFREMLGFDGGAAAADPPPLRELLHPDDREPVYGGFLRQLRDRGVKSGIRRHEPVDCRMRRTDGTYLWVHYEAVAVCGADGRTLRFICSLIDISRARRDMALLREQEEALRRQVELTRTEQRRLDLVVRGARVGIVDWDGHTHETYYSPRFREIRGFPSDADTAGWPDYFKVMIHPEDRGRITGRWVAFIRGKGPEGPRGEFYAPEEYRLRRADGGYAWVEVSGMAVRDAAGFVVRWIAAVIDIGERRAQQEQLRLSHDQIAAQAALLERQNEALKENVRLREEVERIGRHDIKTPLNSIVAVPRLLREERRLGPEADELLGIVERAGYRILSMVNLSLDLYKMEQGSYILRPDAVDLAELVDKVLADVRMHAASKGVRFEVDLARAPYAWAEELLCYSLLGNLTKNAVEASPEGGVVTLRGERGPGGTVMLQVRNRGAVPQEVRASFFEKYATQGKASGTGLGTYSARLMARVQEGDIVMHTSDEDGTRLTVTLRAAAAGVVPTTVRHAAAPQQELLPLAAVRPLRVLLVDDDEYNLLIVRRFLPSPPFEVASAINGRMALEAMERQWPEVVFMDLDMPVMGGLEAVRAIRERQAGERRGPCVIVALSSHEDDLTRDEALAAGFDRYLTKPVAREVVLHTLLQIARAETAATSPPPLPVRAASPAPAVADPVLVEAVMEPLLRDYLASRRALIVEMVRSVGAGAREELRQGAHKLAGSFALYGFRWASEQCRWIEHNHAQVAAERVQALAGELQAHLDTVEIRFIPPDPLPQ